METTSPVFEVSSSHSLDRIDQGLNDAAARHKFGILTVHNLAETMKKKGVDFSGECLIYEVCNPHQAKKVLEADGSISAALPCRISVYRKGGHYQLSTIKPTAMMGMFGRPELDSVAKEVEEVLLAMMKEAAA